VGKKLLLLILVIICITPAGCASQLAPVPAELTPLPPASPSPSGPPTKVVSIDIGWPSAKNWNSDADIDGIEVILNPEDANNEVAQTDGIVSAQLWPKQVYMEGEPEGEPAQQWQNIQVTVKNYNYKSGVTIRLEYKGFVPSLYQVGTLQVILQTPDGKVFSTRAFSIKLH
jgi:hypothetical protein